jgi:hypothetical protein
MTLADYKPEYSFCCWQAPWFTIHPRTATVGQKRGYGSLAGLVHVGLWEAICFMREGAYETQQRRWIKFEIQPQRYLTINHIR